VGNISAATGTKLVPSHAVLRPADAPIWQVNPLLHSPGGPNQGQLQPGDSPRTCHGHALIWHVMEISDTHKDLGHRDAARG
jgi:hypothetical protein